MSLLMLLLSSCATAPERFMFSMPSTRLLNNQSLWPAKPQVSRYSYIGDIRGESNQVKDGSQQDSVVSKFFAALVGLESDLIAPTDLMRPQQGVVDANGRIYVVDTGRQAVFVFDEKSSEFFIWNEDRLNISFKSPVGIALAEASILITDSEQAVVYIFNAQGKIINTIGAGTLQRPTGIAYDPFSKRIFVSDTRDDNIKIYDLEGVLLDTIGGRGSKPGEFNRPTFLSFHNHKLYVADSLNARIQIFNDQDEVIQSIGERGLYVGNFSRPKGVAVDSQGNIYVTESYYDYLLIYNPAGELLMSIGGSGNKAGQFSQPTGVWVDDKDRVFVSDMLNGRVSLFQYLGGN